MDFTSEKELNMGLAGYLRVYSNNLVLIDKATKEYEELVTVTKGKVSIEQVRDLLVTLNSDPSVDVTFDGNKLGVTKNTVSSNIIFIALEVCYLVRKYKFNESDISEFYDKVINQIVLNTLNNRNYFSNLDTKLNSDEAK